jgi:hypothetical protein
MAKALKASFDSYAFVLNLYKYTGPLPLQIADNIALDRATAAQADGIRELLGQYGNSIRTGQWLYYVEPLEEPLKGSHFFVPIAPNQTKFWVLNFFGDPMAIWRFCTAAQLTDAELDIAATFHPKQGNGIQQLEPTRVFHFWEQHLNPVLQPLNSADLLNALNYRDKMEDLAAKAGPIAEAEETVVRVYGDFARLSFGPRSGHLVLLGHFALIEALITHDPHKLGDSLNHQLSNKMPLLMRRFDVPLNPSPHFAIDDPKTLWKRLYEVRSIIAHGGRLNFKKGHLRELGDIDSVQSFVRTALKRLIVQAMYEPQFVFDLKAC